LGVHHQGVYLKSHLFCFKLLLSYKQYNVYKIKGMMICVHVFLCVTLLVSIVLGIKGSPIKPNSSPQLTPYNLPTHNLGGESLVTLGRKEINLLHSSQKLLIFVTNLKKIHCCERWT
jgi:hypothetical protein